MPRVRRHRRRHPGRDPGGTRRALDDLRGACGVRGLPQLRGPARRRARRRDDRARLRHRRLLPQPHTSPADVIAESYRIQRVLQQLGWTLLRMSGGDIKLLLPAQRRPAAPHRRFVAFRVGETFYQLGNRSGRLPDSAILPVSTVTLHGVSCPRPPTRRRCSRSSTGRMAGARPVVQVRRPGARRTAAGRLAARLPHRQAGWTSSTTGPAAACRLVVVREVGRRGVPPGAAIADSGAAPGATRSGSPAAGPPGAGLRLLPRRPAALTQGRAAPRSRSTWALILNELRTVLVTGAELSHDPHHLCARNFLGCLDDMPGRSCGCCAGWRCAAAACCSWSSVPEAGWPAARSRPDWCTASTPAPWCAAEIEAAGGVVERQRVRV